MTITWGPGPGTRGSAWPEAGWRRPSSTFGGKKSAPGTMPSACRWTSERMSTSSAPARMAAYARSGSTRCNLARASASRSFTVFRTTLEIPTAAEPGVQEHARDRESADPVDEKRPQGADVPDEPGEVLAEEPGDERQGKEDRGDQGQLLRGLVLAHADLVLPHAENGEIRLQDRRQQLALRRDLFVHELDVVVDVTEVALHGVRHAGVGSPFDRCQRRQQRVDGAEELDHPPLE